MANGELTFDRFAQSGDPPTGVLTERVRILRVAGQVIFRREDGVGLLIEERDATPDETDHLVDLENKEIANTPILLNGWEIFDAGNTWEDPAYSKDGEGIVHLRGLIKNGTANAAAFMLPVGYRPNQRQIFLVADNGGVGMIDIIPDGQVFVRTGTANGWVSLSGISFFAV